MRIAVLALTFITVIAGGLFSPPEVAAVPTVMPRGLQLVDVDKIIPGVIIYSSPNNTSYAISPFGNFVYRAYWVPPVWFGLEPAQLMRGEF